jgi:drug/metabolite transporter (DMT)-like permease
VTQARVTQSGSGGSSPSHSGATATLLLGTTLISFAPVFVQLYGRVVAPLDPQTTGSAFYRMAIGALGLTGIAVVMRQSFHVSLRTRLYQVLAGLIFAADLAVWHVSIERIGAGLATLLANFQVVLLVLHDGVVLRKRIGLGRWLSVPLALLGLVLLVGVHWSQLSGEDQVGIALGLLTAFFFASYILSLPRTQDPERAPAPFANFAVVSGVAALALAVLVPATGESFAVPGWEAILVLLGLGIVCQTFGQLFFYRGRMRAEASKAGLILLLQPVLAFTWEMLAFGRELHLREFAGISIAIAAIWLGTRR